MTLALLAIVGLLLVGGGYRIAGVLGASVGVILLIALLLLTGRRAYEITKGVVDDTWTRFWEQAEQIAEWWFPFPGRLMDKIWELATRLGKSMGGNIW